MARLAQNTANHGIAAPLLIVQGLADVVVPPPATHAYVAERCAAGQRLEYWTFAGLDHGSIVQLGSLDDIRNGRYLFLPPPERLHRRWLRAFYKT